MEVIILSRYSFASSISDIHLNTSMMTCMGFVFIYWASYFYIFSREGGDISGLILGEGNIESTNALGIMLRWGWGGVIYVSVFLVYSRGVGDIGFVFWGYRVKLVV